MVAFQHQSFSAALALRIVQVGITGLLLIWIFIYLGGLSFSPKMIDEETNDTFGIFNWHPLLMSLAFIGCMSEAILTYSSPLVHSTDRKLKKYTHAALHAAACVLTVCGIVAAIKSHTLKAPTPMPNFYSTHSYLGVLTCLMMIGQIVFGVMAYLYPQWSLGERQAFSSVHTFCGGATLCVGMMTLMVGLQEKTTFLQLVQKPNVRGALMQIPAFIQVGVALFTVLVLYQVVFVSKLSQKKTTQFAPILAQDAEHEINTM